MPEDEGFFAEALVQASCLLGDNPAFVIRWQERAIVTCNAAVERVFGYTPAELQGQNTRMLHVSDADCERFGEVSSKAMEVDLNAYHCHFHMRRRDGSTFMTEHFVQPITEADGTPVATLSIVRDLDEAGIPPLRSDPLQVERFHNQVPGAILQHVRTPDGHDTCPSVAGKLVDLLGVDREALKDSIDPLFRVIHPADLPVLQEQIAESARDMTPLSTEIRVRTPMGGQVWLRYIAHPYAMPGGEILWEGILLEITEYQDELNRIGHHDSVTRLLSRRGFVDALARHAESNAWSPTAMVVMFDMKSQREVNDTHGYDAGDQVLREVGARLVERAGAGAIVARMGGDAFAIFIQPRAGMGPTKQCRQLARAFSRPIIVEGVEIQPAARGGYARFGRTPRNVQHVIQEAEMALFQARETDASEAVAYHTTMRERRREHSRMVQEMHAALEQNQFELHFQPIVHLASGELVSCEALTRWRHPIRGLQHPSRFINWAEQNNLIAPIGDWVLRETCRTLRQWADAGLDPVNTAINVSIIQLRLAGFVQNVRNTLEEFRVHPGQLTLEVTESVFEQDSKSLQNHMQELHELGIKLSMDDFGTGYSSLLYLKQYPFDEIKVDLRFVNQILHDRYSRKIVSTVLDIAAALNAHAVAEGIESVEVRDALLDLGCEFGQGYYYSMPVAAEDFRWMLERRTILPRE